MLALDGPPCCGKTALLHEAVDAARDRGYAVVLVSGTRLADSADVADALNRGPRPLVAVDDAHENPTAVLELLARLADTAATVLLAFDGTRAGVEVPRSLAGAVLPLGPLADDAVRALVVGLLGATPEPDLAAFVATAGGNPRLVVDLVTGLREEGQLQLRDGTAALRGGWLPQRVARVVRARVERLPARATQLLRVSAVIGRSFLLHDAATLMGETTAALLLSVDEVIASGLVVCTDERLEFSSDLVWRAVVESIPESVLHALRHDAAVLRTSLPEPETPPGDRDRGAVAVRGVRALAANGRLGSAIALARDSLALRPGQGFAAELHVLLAGILLADGRPADAVAEMDRAIAAPLAAEPLRRLATAGRLLSLYFATGNRAGAHVLSVLTTRDREASDADVVMAATVHSCLEWSAGNLAEGVYWGRESTRWELDGPTSWWQSQAEVSFAMKLAALGEFDAAERLVLGDGPDIDSAVTSGAPAARMIARARVLTQAGRLAQAGIAAQAGLAMARDRGLRLLVPLACTVLATVALLRGDVPGAAEHVRRYRGDLAGGEAVLHSGQYDWVELLLAHAAGGPGRASELARERLSDLDGARRMLIEEPGAAPWLARLALTVGDSRLADVVVSAAEELAGGNPGFTPVSVAASHARALVDRDVDALRSAAQAHPHPWARANANEDLSHLFADAGRADRAEEHCALAVKIFEQMGADGEAARLRRRTGLVPETTERGGEEWQRLTEPERDIARLVGAGMTNRQVGKQLFLSPHTVNYHLRGIFKKLGISSRVELARLAHEQATADTAV
ncbi:LuxR C-terminal-related transcriptional regulator [Actinosynnema sp. NPDC020468]|uniref:helix-turn-helix transcriptional regulator n=1 Tax=Actinosynnema sp. NPDC020468 TaxID=3154488 RepID=UPI00340F4610